MLTFERTDFAAGDRPSSAALADFNGDGNTDIVTANGLSDTEVIFLSLNNN